MKVIIDVLNLSNTENITNGSLASALIIKAYKNGIFIPKNATNGEVIQALFPNIDKGFSNVIDLNLWWNAKCKVEIDIIDELEKIKAEIEYCRKKHNCGVLECSDVIDKEIKAARRNRWRKGENK